MVQYIGIWRMFRGILLVPHNIVIHLINARLTLHDITLHVLTSLWDQEYVGHCARILWGRCKGGGKSYIDSMSNVVFIAHKSLSHVWNTMHAMLIE